MSSTVGYNLGIQLMKRVLATHTHYVGEELLQQLDERNGGASTGSSSGGGASAHVRVDWDGPVGAQGYGIVVYFIMGSPEDKLSYYTKGRDTKRFSAEEQHKHGMRTAKPFVRAVSRNTPVSPKTGPNG